MATIIMVDGGVKPLKDTSLDSLQETVGGFIEAVPLVNGGHLVLNEEGHMMGLEPNDRATRILSALGPIGYGTLIIGDAVLCEKGELK